MRIEDITEDNLREFLRWYQEFHGSRPADESVITTCMCGYFGTFPKAANKLLARCDVLELVNVDDGVVTFST